MRPRRHALVRRGRPAIRRVHLPASALPLPHALDEVRVVIGDVCSGRGGAMGEPVRLAEMLGALSLGVDLGFGQPMEHVLRQCRIALRLADHLDLDEEEHSTVYYTALLTNV